MNFLTIDGKGKLVLERAKDTVEITSIDQLKQAETEIYCSSSVDFPEENTSDESVIALCKEIRKLNL